LQIHKTNSSAIADRPHRAGQTGQGGIVMAESRRLELGDNILRTL